MVKGPVFRPIRDKPLVHYSPLFKGSKSGFLKKKEKKRMVVGRGRGDFCFIYLYKLGEMHIHGRDIMFASKFF